MELKDRTLVIGVLRLLISVQKIRRILHNVVFLMHLCILYLNLIDWSLLQLTFSDFIPIIRDLKRNQTYGHHIDK